MPGQPVDALLPERLRESYSAHREKVNNGSEAVASDPDGELFARRKDGSKFAMEIGLSVIHTDEGELTLCSVNDVTERSRTAMELDQQRQELAHLSRVASLGVLSGALVRWPMIREFPSGTTPKFIYRACAGTRLFSQEVLRVIFLDTRDRHCSTVEMLKSPKEERKPLCG